MTKENDELQPAGDTNMVLLMEEVDSESGSQKALQGVDVDDPPMRKKGRDYGDPGETRDIRGSA